MEDERVRKLAETLKNSHLAASMSEAIEKAKSILSATTAKTEIPQEKTQKMPSEPDYNITKETIPLNELMKEVNVNPEQVSTQEQEKLNDIKTEITEIKEDIKEAEKKPEKMQEIKEKITDVKDKVNKIMESKEENNKKDDMFNEEKKVDLTKVFNYKK